MLEQIFQHITNAWNIYLIITAAFGIIIGCATWLNSTYKKISSCLRTLNSLSEQFKNNCGSSIKDLLDRVEDKSNKIEFMIHVYLDIVSIPIFITDNNGKCTWANRSYLNLVGMTLDDITGTGWEMAIDNKDKDVVLKEWYRACSELRPFHMRFNIRNNNKIVFVKCESYGKKEIGYIGFLTEVQ